MMETFVASEHNKVHVAALQCELNDSLAANVQRVVDLIEQACALGAQVIVLPELFEGPYFCSQQAEKWFALAKPVAEQPTLARLQVLALKRQVVVVASFFERDGPHYYNSAAVIDADGQILGVYRKTHLPDGPGYQEKFYFRPGGQPPRVFATAYLQVGLAICWDQWFPEVARMLTLRGAELLVYPTAIGSEPQAPSLDTCPMWRRVMIGHAVANAVPVLAANRVGAEAQQTFYGHSFIADHTGNILSELGQVDSGVVHAYLDRPAAVCHRAAFGFFRDRRPELYNDITQL